jgi:pyruvate-formate lyase-activating enzyme
MHEKSCALKCKGCNPPEDSEPQQSLAKMQAAQENMQQEFHNNFSSITVLYTLPAKNGNSLQG